MKSKLHIIKILENGQHMILVFLGNNNYSLKNFGMKV